MLETTEILYHKVFFRDENADWVVFVHGAGGSSSIWFKQLRDFRNHFNLLLIDLRGHGKSQHRLEEWAQEQYSFDKISKEIIEVLNVRKIEAAHFIGISLGTILIRQIGEQFPSRVKSMIMGGAIIRLTLRSKLLVWAGRLSRRFIPFMWIYKLCAFIIMPKQRHKESRILFINEAKKIARKEFMRWFKLTRGLNPLLKFYREKEVTIPTLYVMGEEDYMFLPGVNEVVSSHSNSWLSVIPDSGHVCNVDQPELFNKVSISFIQGGRKF
jgi:pimeloyl-ACP methyl ester carboxylesterase